MLGFAATLVSCMNPMDEGRRAPYRHYQQVGGLHGVCDDPKMSSGCPNVTEPGE